MVLKFLSFHFHFRRFLISWIRILILLAEPCGAGYTSMIERGTNSGMNWKFVCDSELTVPLKLSKIWIRRRVPVRIQMKSGIWIRINTTRRSQEGMG